MSDTQPINCEQALRLLFDYLDRELEGNQHRDVEQHLQRCRSCYSRAEFERHLKSHLTELASHPVVPSFQERIKALINHFPDK